MIIASNYDALSARTAASIREMIAYVDAILGVANLNLLALERTYVTGGEGTSAGDETVFAKLEEGRLLTEIAREARNRLLVVVEKMESRAAC
jgi:hypothetical protein